MVAEPDQAAPVWPAEVGWRVRSGAGLLLHTPMSPERRAQFDREAEREARALEFEAEQARERAIEKRWELQRQGIEAHSVGDVLQSAALAQDRQDRRDQKDDEQYTERFGHGRPRQWVSQLADAKREREQREAAAEVEPVSKAELGRVAKKVQAAIWNITGKRPEL
jgi:hypothetical protein